MSGLPPPVVLHQTPKYPRALRSPDDPLRLPPGSPEKPLALGAPKFGCCHNVEVDFKRPPTFWASPSSASSSAPNTITKPCHSASVGTCQPWGQIPCGLLPRTNYNGNRKSLCWSLRFDKRTLRVHWRSQRRPMKGEGRSAGSRCRPRNA